MFGLRTTWPTGLEVSPVLEFEGFGATRPAQNGSKLCLFVFFFFLGGGVAYGPLNMFS